MRTSLRMLVAVGTILVLQIAGVCLAEDADAPEPDDGVDVYFRDSDLEALAAQDLAVYGDVDPGDSELIEPSFVSAPPQIPHSVEGLLPIQSDSNECLECHMPNVAADVEAVPIPESHFMTPTILGTPDNEEADVDATGGMLVVIDGYEKSSELSGTRFNCTLCHAPQATNVESPKNLFGGEAKEEGKSEE